LKRIFPPFYTAAIVEMANECPYHNMSGSKYYFITGTSRGIGNAIAEQLLKSEDCFITGIGRTCTITHSRYSHIAMDLANISEVNDFRFPEIDAASEIILINNSGTTGAVRYAGRNSSEEIAQTFNVNLLSVAVLINNFLKTYLSKNIPLRILNISSGAAKNPIDGWSAYCASKAGLDMLSRTIAEELKISRMNHVRIFSIAPGIVDTAMQDEIRQSNVRDFSRIQQFVEYKNTDQLASPLLTARLLLSILEAPEKFEETVFSVRDLKQ
jgi:benzil reductase ((S)-benzoin forming)